jgi:hypothetical protein
MIRAQAVQGLAAPPLWPPAAAAAAAALARSLFLSCGREEGEGVGGSGSETGGRGGAAGRDKPGEAGGLGCPLSR